MQAHWYRYYVPHENWGCPKIGEGRTRYAKLGLFISSVSGPKFYAATNHRTRLLLFRLQRNFGENYPTGKLPEVALPGPFSFHLDLLPSQVKSFLSSPLPPLQGTNRLILFLKILCRRETELYINLKPLLYSSLICAKEEFKDNICTWHRNRNQ